MWRGIALCAVLSSCSLLFDTTAGDDMSGGGDPDSAPPGPGDPDADTSSGDAGGQPDARPPFMPDSCEGGEVRVIVEVESNGNAGNSVEVNGYVCFAQTGADVTCQFCMPQEPITLSASGTVFQNFLGWVDGSYGGNCPCSPPQVSTCLYNSAPNINCKATFETSF